MNNNQHHRRSIRLKEYDYTQNGAYYVTICTQDKKCVLSNIVNEKTILTNYGKIVEEEWLKTKSIRPYVDLDYYVIMPNHFHGIISINKFVRATRRVAPTQTLPPNSLGSIIGQFKSNATKKIRKLGYKNFKWQRNYYEHIIRNDDDLNRIREYIKNNPLKWMMDKNYSKKM